MLDFSQLRPERPRLLSRKEYERLVAQGFFEEERVELLHGVVVTMNKQSGPHSGISAFLARGLICALDESFDVRSHSPFAASDYSEPEPDVGVYPQGPRDDHPSRAFLIVEVADSTQAKDRRIKAGIYAAAGVPEYWIVDLQHDRVEVLTDPDQDTYQQLRTLRRGEVLRPSALPGVELAVADVLG